jgi:hypothetical protein
MMILYEPVMAARSEPNGTSGIVEATSRSPPDNATEPHQVQMAPLSKMRRRVLPGHKSSVLEQEPVRDQNLGFLSYPHRFSKETKENFMEKD